MNLFDYYIIGFINQFSRHSEIFDKIMVSLADTNLLKGGIIVGIIWSLWFTNKDDHKKVTARQHIVIAFISCFIALFTARIMQLTLPFRLRPIHNPNLDFIIPYNDSISTLQGMSSFPSDHAVLFFTLAFSIYYIDKKYGILSILHVALLICFPRVYLGFHYPTDILAGLVLGFIFASTSILINNRFRLTKPFDYLLHLSPGLFYFCFFIISYQFATLFDDVRFIADKAFKLLFKYL